MGSTRGCSESQLHIHVHKVGGKSQVTLTVASDCSIRDLRQKVKDACFCASNYFDLLHGLQQLPIDGPMDFKEGAVLTLVIKDVWAEFHRLSIVQDEQEVDNNDSDDLSEDEDFNSDALEGEKCALADDSYELDIQAGPPSDLYPKGFIHPWHEAYLYEIPSSVPCSSCSFPGYMGYYLQAKYGDIDISRYKPSGDDDSEDGLGMLESYNMHAHKQCQGMSREDAAFKYIEVVTAMLSDKDLICRKCAAKGLAECDGECQCIAEEANDAALQFMSECDGSDKAVRQAFQDADANGDGYMEREDLSRVFHMLGGDAIDELLILMDVNADRKVSYEEFLDFLFQTKKKHEKIVNREKAEEAAFELGQKCNGCPEAIRDEFQKADVNGDGFIGMDELRQMFNSMDSSLEAGPLEELFISMDVNEDGKISYNEFLDHLYSEYEEE